MATNSIGLIGAVTPSVDLLTLAERDSSDHAGQRFVVIRLGEDVTVIPPGFGAEQITYLRTLAAALTAAADELAQPATEAVGHA